MATVDSDKVVCGGIHAMTVAVLVKVYPYTCISGNTYLYIAGYLSGFFSRYLYYTCTISGYPYPCITVYIYPCTTGFSYCCFTGDQYP
jgi:hypothetical protein